MAVNSLQVAQNMLSYTVAQDRRSLLNLLSKYGIEVPNNPSDREITVAVLMASGKSPAFKNDLTTLLTKNVEKAADEYSSFVGGESDFGFTGIDDFSFTGIEEFQNLGGLFKKKDKTGTTPTTTKVKTPKPTKVDTRAPRITDDNPKGKTGFGIFLQNLGRSLTSEETINNALNAGLTTLNNRTATRQNEISNQANYIAEQADLQRREQLRLQQPKTSAVTWVLVGVGVLALVGIVYFVARKKK
jgi:hypothetical protein